jgi:hypothetical protein
MKAAFDAQWISSLRYIPVGEYTERRTNHAISSIVLWWCGRRLSLSKLSQALLAISVQHGHLLIILFIESHWDGQPFIVPVILAFFSSLRNAAAHGQDARGGLTYRNHWLGFLVSM